MFNRVAVIRIVGFLLAFVLLFGDWPQMAGDDELRSDPTHRHGSAPMAIGDEAGTCDHLRVARGVCDIHPVTSIDRPATTLAALEFQAQFQPLSRDRRLYDLNAVLRI